MTVWAVGGGLAVLLVAFLFADPFKLSPVAHEVDFVPSSVPYPSRATLADISRDKENKLKAAEIKFGNQIYGPESVVFDSQGRGPYAGVGDGRVVRWDGPEVGWVEFAVVIPNRTSICDPASPPAPSLQYEHLCGRPLGLRFHKKTGDLYIADAYFGILVVGPEGGVAKVITNEVEGKKFVFTNDLAVDDDGTIYFSDSSAKHPRSKFFFAILESENTGRVLKYDPKTKETTVLVRGLRFANGVTFSKDHSFLVIAETRVGRLLRYWLKGPKSGQVEDFVWLAGYPDNVRTNEKGEFWVALHCTRNRFDRFFGSVALLRKSLLKLPLSLKTLYFLLSGKPHGAIVKYSEDGKLLQVLEDQKGEVVTFVSEVEEKDGKLYLGSVLVPHVAVYTL